MKSPGDMKQEMTVMHPTNRNLFAVERQFHSSKNNVNADFKRLKGHLRILTSDYYYYWLRLSTIHNLICKEKRELFKKLIFH